MSAPGSIAWIARHELRLAWRDWLAMMTAGGRTRVRTLLVVLLGATAFMHAIASAACHVQGTRRSQTLPFPAR